MSLNCHISMHSKTKVVSGTTSNFAFSKDLVLLLSLQFFSMGNVAATMDMFAVNKLHLKLPAD